MHAADGMGVAWGAPRSLCHVKHWIQPGHHRWYTPHAGLMGHMHSEPRAGMRCIQNREPTWGVCAMCQPPVPHALHKAMRHVLDWPALEIAMHVPVSVASLGHVLSAACKLDLVLHMAQWSGMQAACGILCCPWHQVLSALPMPSLRASTHGTWAGLSTTNTLQGIDPGPACRQAQVCSSRLQDWMN